ncbi:MAG: hypothetical protein V4628_01860 [Pseudomonadota bacterium]
MKRDNKVMLLVLSVLSMVVATIYSPWGLAQALLPFPALSGSYQVGHTELDMTDTARLEIYTEEPDDQRRLLVSLYYPASVPADATPSAYITPELAAALGVPQEFQNQISTSYANAPISDGNFPVLIFSPGAGNMTQYYSSLLSELASRGFVVAGIWPTYSANIALFPDGTLIKRSPAAEVTGESLEEQLASIATVGAVWVEDQRFVLSQLERLNTSDPLLEGHLDVSRVGVFGHSLGGAAAVETAYQDERFDAALNMDGTMFGAVTTAGSRVPFMFLQSDPPPPTDEQIAGWGITRAEFDAEDQLLLDAVDLVVDNSPNGSSLAKLKGSRHRTYMIDQLFFTPRMSAEQKTNVLGDVDPMRAYQQIVTWVSDFMAMHLQ